MRTLSEISEEMWRVWFDERQEELRPLVEEVIREKLGLDESFEITWTEDFALR